MNALCPAESGRALEDKNKIPQILDIKRPMPVKSYSISS